uniref:hypothetical protein n=1 Tax=Trichocoleus desertorum TaxID=1481672 RepID=UPI0025B2AEBD|nr:hypothetical protein [Trichocoleus desertorum]
MRNWFASSKILSVTALLGLSILVCGSARKQSSTLVIWNDSPATLIVDLTQRQTGQKYKIKVKPCPKCQHYVALSPLTCEKKGTVGSYAFAPGTYDAKVTFSDRTVPPSEDEFVLESDTTHMHCFSIVTQMLLVPGIR